MAGGVVGTAARTRSITFCLTALFALLASIVLLLLGLLVGRLVDEHFEELDMATLQGAQTLLRHALSAPDQIDSVRVAAFLDNALVGQEGLSLIVVNADGRVLFERGNAEFPPELLGSRAASSASEGNGSDQHSQHSQHSKRDVTPVRPLVWINSAGQHFRGVANIIEVWPDGPRAQVAVATNLVHHEHFMRSFSVMLWGVVVFAALAIGVLGWFAVRRGLAPLHAIRREAAEVTAHRLDFRLSDKAVPFELAELVRTLNDMFARLEDSFRRLSDFSSDLAHELRTPVSNLLTQTQVTLSRPRSGDEYRDILASNTEELERLARMVSDMLFLAKAENGLLVPERRAVDLTVEISDLFEFYDAWADEKSIILVLAGEGVVSGDRLMLRRALSNLLSNAIRHTPEHGRVMVEIQAAAQWIPPGCQQNSSGAEASTVGGNRFVRLAVLNSGSLIPVEHRARLFDRFYRAEPSRQRTGDEAGLGLAITRSILVAHGGDIVVGDEAGMTAFILYLPVA